MFRLCKLTNLFLEKKKRRATEKAYWSVKNRVDNLYVKEFNFKYVYIHFVRESVNPYIKDSRIPDFVNINVAFTDFIFEDNYPYYDFFDNLNLDRNILAAVKDIVNKIQYIIYPELLVETQRAVISLPFHEDRKLQYKHFSILNPYNVEFSVRHNSERCIDFSITYNECNK